jgi:hypothetical protein
MKCKQGPGFPLTRKRVGGSLEILIASILALLVLGAFGFDSVELGRLYEFLKGLNAFSLS